jgi:hypothetical protein
MTFKRAFPSSKPFNVADQCHMAPYELTEDQIAQSYIKPGPDTYEFCTVHTEPIPEVDPFWPFWPDDPNEPTDPDYPGYEEDPDAEEDPDSDQEEEENNNSFGNWWDHIFNP